MEPKPIEPQDIRVGMRVRRTLTHESGRIMIDEFTVRAVDGGAIDFDDHAGFAADHRATWTLLADAPKPTRPVGSHWRDPVTGAEYVKTDKGSKHDAQYLAYVHGREVGLDAVLVPDFALRDAEIIARLQPIPAFDPATLWPVRNPGGRRCGVFVQSTGDIGFTCSRENDHDGLHAAYASHAQGVQPVYVWGRP